MQWDDKGRIYVTDEKGRYLTSENSGELTLTDAPAENDLSVWYIRKTNGGIWLINSGSDASRAVGLKNGYFTAFSPNFSSQCLINFYEINDK